MRTTKLNQTIILRHILAWIIFITYEVSISAILGASMSCWSYFPFYVLHILLFYSYASFCLYLVRNKRQWWFYLIPLAIVLMILHQCLILSVEIGLSHFHLSDGTFVFTIKGLAGSVWRGIYFLLLSSCYCMIIYIIEKNNQVNQLELKNLEAEKDRYKLENAYLLVQMNPHLLFNSLSFIYNSVRKVSPEAAKGVVILSDIMRHVLSGPDENGLILIDNEIDHINKLIEISRLRFQNGFYLSFNVKGVWDNVKIPPLILVTFVENLLKHGDLTESQCPGVISLEVNPENILFSTQNLIKKTDLSYSTRIGIKNAKLRLDSYFGQEKYQLDFRKTVNNYNIMLNIKL